MLFLGFFPSTPLLWSILNLGQPLFHLFFTFLFLVIFPFMLDSYPGAAHHEVLEPFFACYFPIT